MAHKASSIDQQYNNLIRASWATYNLNTSGIIKKYILITETTITATTKQQKRIMSLML